MQKETHSNILSCSGVGPCPAVFFLPRRGRHSVSPGFFVAARGRSWRNAAERWEPNHVHRLPPGGKLSPQVTDEGATLYPTEREKNTVALSKRRRTAGPPAPLGTRSPPHPTRLTPGHLPPEGKAMAPAALWVSAGVVALSHGVVRKLPRVRPVSAVEKSHSA